MSTCRPDWHPTASDVAAEIDVEEVRDAQFDRLTVFFSNAKQLPACIPIFLDILYLSIMSTVSIQLTGTSFPQGASRSRKMRPWTTVMHPRGWSLLGMKVMNVMKVVKLKVKRAKAGGPRIGPIGRIPRLQIQEM